MSSDFGSTDYGFVPRQLADIQKAMNEAVSIIIDPATGQKPFQNISDDSRLQQVLAIIAEAVGIVENSAAMAFEQRDPLSATGVGLSSLVQLNGVQRKPGAPTIITEKISGPSGTTIPAGFQVGDVDGTVIYQTIQAETIPANGVLIATMVATTIGANDPEVDTVTSVLTALPNVAVEATNIATLSVGTNEESDEALRARQQLSIMATSYRNIDAINAAVLNVPGVTFSRAYQNITLATDDRGVPGKTVACVVVGGDNVEIAQAIAFRLGFANTWGNQTVQLYGVNSMPMPISFSRPVEIPIDVAITLQIVVDENIQIFPSNGIDLIRQAIIRFAQYGHTSCEPMGNPGFPPGQDIIRSQLYTPINSVGGAKIISVKLGVDGEEPSEQDIPIAWDEIGIFTPDRIQVTFA